MEDSDGKLVDARLILLVCAIFLFICFWAGSAVGYQHNMVVGKMTFDWTIRGNVLAVKLSAPTRGWVGIGFNPEYRMKSANFIVGFVKAGKVTIVDEFGTMSVQHVGDHRLGGRDDVTIVGGVEDAGGTAIEFSIPLNSGDKFDGKLDVTGDTVVLLAYGPDQDSLRVKHQFYARKVVNLGNGRIK